MLDEIFKCNDGVLNSLLTALNERKYTNEGRTYPTGTPSFRSWHRISSASSFTASGTGIAATSACICSSSSSVMDAAALYDRLELKVVTDNISDRAKRLAVLADEQAKRAGRRRKRCPPRGSFRQ